MIYVGNHIYILHLVWRPIFSATSRYITRYLVCSI